MKILIVGVVGLESSEPVEPVWHCLAVSIDRLFSFIVTSSSHFMSLPAFHMTEPFRLGMGLLHYVPSLTLYSLASHSPSFFHHLALDHSTIFNHHPHVSLCCSPPHYWIMSLGEKFHHDLGHFWYIPYTFFIWGKHNSNEGQFFCGLVFSEILVCCIILVSSKVIDVFLDVN